MKKLTYLLIAGIIFIAGCKKENEPVSLKVYPEHHGKHIYGATAYIKFNAHTNPAPVTNYDLKVQGNASEDFILVDAINRGDHFIYCVGYDPAISMPVIGGIPFAIPEDYHGEFILEVPVAE
jgi:hypothetical protein